MDARTPGQAINQSPNIIHGHSKDRRTGGQESRGKEDRRAEEERKKGREKERKRVKEGRKDRTRRRSPAISSESSSTSSRGSA